MVQKPKTLPKPKRAVPGGNKAVGGAFPSRKKRAREEQPSSEFVPLSALAPPRPLSRAPTPGAGAQPRVRPPLSAGRQGGAGPSTVTPGLEAGAEGRGLNAPEHRALAGGREAAPHLLFHAVDNDGRVLAAEPAKESRDSHCGCPAGGSGPAGGRT